MQCHLVSSGQLVIFKWFADPFVYKGNFIVYHLGYVRKLLNQNNHKHVTVAVTVHNPILNLSFLLSQWNP